MTATRTLLFINPWYGMIGPNVGMRQLAQDRVVMAVGRGDEQAERLRVLGVEVHVIADLELTRRARGVKERT
jgi:hypothetical protein